MADAKLSELDTSRLGTEFKELPREERRRISRANTRGHALPTTAERNFQRALFAQIPRWLFTLLAVTLPLQAGNAWTRYADEHSTWQLVPAVVCTMVTPGIWWQWWATRRLGRELAALTEQSHD